MTLAEGEDEASIERAPDAVRAMREKSGFNPGAFMNRMGIQADLREYRARDR